MAETTTTTVTLYRGFELYDNEFRRLPAPVESSKVHLVNRMGKPTCGTQRYAVNPRPKRWKGTLADVNCQNCLRKYDEAQNRKKINEQTSQSQPLTDRIMELAEARFDLLARREAERAVSLLQKCADTINGWITNPETAPKRPTRGYGYDRGNFDPNPYDWFNFVFGEERRGGRPKADELVKKIVTTGVRQPRTGEYFVRAPKGTLYEVNLDAVHTFVEDYRKYIFQLETGKLRYHCTKYLTPDLQESTINIDAIEDEILTDGVMGFEVWVEFETKEGKKFRFKTNAFEAGGYNIQCLHFRYRSNLKEITQP